MANGQDQPTPAAPEPDYGYGPRWDEATQSYSGPPKGLGFLGPLLNRQGQVMSEFSRDGIINGKPTQYPLIVPTLSKEELSYLLQKPDAAPVPPSIEQKAAAYATQRAKAGRSPFALTGEQQLQLYPDLARAPIPKPVTTQAAVPSGTPAATATTPAEFDYRFPDGHVETVSGPASMSDGEIQAAAKQQRAYHEHPMRSLAANALENRMLTGGVITGAGMLTGQPEIVAAAPLGASLIRGATQRLTGEPVDITPGGLAADLLTGAALGYGSRVLGAGARAAAGTTVAHVSPISGNLVEGATGSGVLPWMIRTGGEALQGLGTVFDAVTPTGFSAAVKANAPRMLAAMQQGATPYVAAGLAATGGTAAATPTVRDELLRWWALASRALYPNAFPQPQTTTPPTLPVPGRQP